MKEHSACMLTHNVLAPQGSMCIEVISENRSLAHTEAQNQMRKLIMLCAPGSLAGPAGVMRLNLPVTITQHM